MSRTTRIDSEPVESAEPPARITPEGVEPHPRKTGHRVLDLIIAGSAILISCISLMVAVEHGRTMQQLVAANSWPLLQVSSGNFDEKPTITIAIQNVGVGPAIVKSFYADVDGNRISEPNRILQACCGYVVPESKTPYTLADPLTSFVEGTVIRADENRVFLKLDRVPGNDEVWQRLDKARFRMHYHACYCSVLGQCWESDLSGVDPHEVDICPVKKLKAAK